MHMYTKNLQKNIVIQQCILVNKFFDDQYLFQNKLIYLRPLPMRSAPRSLKERRQQFRRKPWFQLDHADSTENRNSKRNLQLQTPKALAQWSFPNLQRNPEGGDRCRRKLPAEPVCFVDVNEILRNVWRIHFA